MIARRISSQSGIVSPVVVCLSRILCWLLADDGGSTVHFRSSESKIVLDSQHNKTRKEKEICTKQREKNVVCQYSTVLQVEINPHTVDI